MVPQLGEGENKIGQGEEGRPEGSDLRPVCRGNSKHFGFHVRKHLYREKMGCKKGQACEARVQGGGFGNNPPGDGDVTTSENLTNGRGPERAHFEAKGKEEKFQMLACRGRGKMTKIETFFIWEIKI